MSLFPEIEDSSPLNRPTELEYEKLERENELLTEQVDKLKKEQMIMMQEHLLIVEQLRQKTVECEMLKKTNTQFLQTKTPTQRTETPHKAPEPTPIQTQKKVESNAPTSTWTDPLAWAIDSISDYLNEQFKEKDEGRSPIEHELPDVATSKRKK
jgi:hypothetical protein